MNDSAVITYTARGFERTISEGGSGIWTLNARRVRKTKYLVCVQNRGKADYHGNDWGNVSAKHKHAFLVGKISDVVLVREKKIDSNGKRKPQKWLIVISEYAEVDYPDMWDGARNPVAYNSLTELGINVDDLKFTKMPKVDKNIEDLVDEEQDVEEYCSDILSEGITIKEAKNLLAIKLDISPDDIEIIIRY